MRLPSAIELRPSARDRFFRVLLCHLFGASSLASLAQDAVTAPADTAPATPASVSSSTSASQFAPAPIGGNPGTLPVSPIAGTSQLGVGIPAGGLPLLGIGDGLYAWGALHLYPHFSYTLTYGNNLQPTPGSQANTLVNIFSPGILIKLGTHWNLDYTPTLRFYSSSQFKDGTDHAVSLSGSTTFGDWALGFSQSYSSSSQPLVETGAQTDQETFLTALNAAYQVNSKISLSLGVDQNFRILGNNAGNTVASGQLSDLHQWSTMEWVNYQIEPPLSAGLGAGFTYDNVSVGPDMMSEPFQARVLWAPGKKLNASISGGVEVRQFLQSNIPDLISPIYSAAITYKVFEPTTLSLSASRGVTPSYFNSQVTENTSVSLGLHQRLVQRLSLELTGSYGTTTYHGTASAPTTSLGIGDYRTTSFMASLGTSFLKRATASVFYEVSFNDSGAALYNYTITQVGLNLGYRF